MSAERERWIQDDLYRMLFAVIRDKRAFDPECHGSNISEYINLTRRN